MNHYNYAEVMRRTPRVKFQQAKVNTRGQVTLALECLHETRDLIPFTRQGKEPNGLRHRQQQRRSEMDRGETFLTAVVPFTLIGLTEEYSIQSSLVSSTSEKRIGCRMVREVRDCYPIGGGDNGLPRTCVEDRGPERSDEENTSRGCADSARAGRVRVWKR